MKLSHILALVLLLIGAWLIYQYLSCTHTDAVEPIATVSRIPFPADLELPTASITSSITRHSGFSLQYDEAHEQPAWVAYMFTSDELTRRAERTDKFLPDPSIISESASDEDYYRSGYDRGHLAPAADMAWSVSAMEESFYYSNISPQEPGFNRGIWKKLESLLRSWVAKSDTLFIVTGPILSDGLEQIGPHGVSVPTHYYKVALGYTTQGLQGIGFILQNQSGNYSLQDVAIPIDSVESVTGLDFFARLPDSVEMIVEANACVPCWDWP